MRGECRIAKTSVESHSIGTIPLLTLYASGAILETMPGYDLLIVDDNPSMHALVRSLLKGTSWNPESANSGEEALARLQERSYDVILTDIVMPGIDGISLLRRIAEIHPD